jgi:hypothetical protein
MASVPRASGHGTASRGVLLALALALAVPSPSSAHVLDQYLQASRIDLQPDGIVIDIGLTPGAEIADDVLGGGIDANHDGQLSEGECEGYARRVLRDVTLAAREQPLTPKLLACRCPAYDDVRAGTGTIHVRAAAAVPLDVPGRHRIVYRNQHQPERGLYVVNALAPSVRGMRIVGQGRDPLQRELQLDYEAGTLERSGGGVSWKLSGFLAMMLLAGILTRRPFARRSSAV